MTWANFIQHENIMKTSLYRHFDNNGKLLYIGISLSFLNRLGQHAEHAHWFNSIKRVEVEHFETRNDALIAELDAIVKEKPAYNIQHNVSFSNSQKKFNEDLSIFAQAKKDLTARVTYFNPAYSLSEAAEALSVNPRLVSQWVRDGKIGYFTMPNKVGKPVPYISGWQLIDYIEVMTNKL